MVNSKPFFNLFNMKTKNHYPIVKTTIINNRVEVESQYYGGIYTKPLNK